MSKKKSSLIATLAKETGVSVEELQKEYEEVIRQLKEAGFKGDVQVVAKNALLSKHRKFKPSAFKRQRKYPVKTFIGFKIGDLGMVDDAQRMRDWAKFQLDRQGREWCEEHGLVRMVDGKLRVLDTRQKIFGRDNKNYGKPLDPKLKLRRRTLIMLVKTPDSDEYEYARLQTNDNRLALAWGQLPQGVLCTFPAAVVSHDTAGYMLNSTSQQGNMTIFRQVKEQVDCYKIFEEWAEPRLTEINEVKQYHEAVKDAWDRWIVVKGVVSSIGFENETFRGIPGTLIHPELGYDPEYSLRFYIPTHLKITFGDYSEIYLLGKTRGITAEQEVETDTGETVKKRVLVDVAVDAWGFFPVPGKSTPPRSSLLESDDEEEIEGFIELE